MSGRRRIKHNDGRSPSQAATEKRLTPSDIHRREQRKAERAALSAQGLLPRQQPTFSCFRNRLSDDGEAIFESPNSQQDLNHAICCLPFGYVVEASKGRVAVNSDTMEAVADALLSKGWVRL